MLIWRSRRAHAQLGFSTVLQQHIQFLLADLRMMLSNSRYRQNTVQTSEAMENVYIVEVMNHHRRTWVCQMSNGPIPDPSNSPAPKSIGVESLPFKLQPNGRISTKMSTEHVWYGIFWLWSDAVNNRTAFTKAPTEWTQIEYNICTVVERPDHHCGDNLV